MNLLCGFKNRINIFATPKVFEYESNPGKETKINVY